MHLERCGLLLVHTSTSRVLLQDTPPKGLQSVVHFGLTSSFSNFGPDLWGDGLFLCSKALWRLYPHIVHLGTLQRLAMWVELKQRKHKRASFIHCVRSSRALARNVFHSDRSCPGLSWNGQCLLFP